MRDQVSNYTFRQALQGQISLDALPLELRGRIQTLWRKMQRQHVRFVKREAKAQQYRAVALAGGGKREVARRWLRT